jgi:hypothetical protein
MDAERSIVLMLDVWCGFRVHVGLGWTEAAFSDAEYYRVWMGERARTDIVLR